MNLMELAKEFGPYCGLIFFFIWRDARREELYINDLKAKNEFIQTTLIGLVNQTNEALNERKS